MQNKQTLAFLAKSALTISQNYTTPKLVQPTIGLTNLWLNDMLRSIMLETNQREHNGIPNPSEFDVVIGLGKNWRLPIQGDRIDLSVESKMTALAAAQMVVNGQAARIIYSTGQTAGVNPETGEPYPAEADEMKSFVRRFFSEEELPSSLIRTETTSFDTAGNAEEVKKILNENGLNNPALVTVGYHGDRARTLFNRNGIRSSFFKSEDILAHMRDGRYYRFLKPSVGIMLKELVARVLVHTVDRQGTGLTRKITAKSRHREQ